MRNSFTYILVGAFIATIVGVWIWAHKPCSEIQKSYYSYDSTLVRNTTFIGDTNSNAVKQSGVDTQYIPRIEYLLHTKLDTIHDTIKLLPDTLAIINEWLNTARYYTQSIRDTDVFITISDSIYQNQIVWRNVDWRILRATQHVQNINKNKTKILVGGQLALNQQRWGLIPGLLVIDKKYRGFSIGYEITNPSPTVHVGFYLPINIKSHD